MCSVVLGIALIKKTKKPKKQPNHILDNGNPSTDAKEKHREIWMLCLRSETK